MSKKFITFVIVSSLILGALGSWVFTRYIVPKLNTIPFLVRYNLAPTYAPLTINTREEIRVNEGSDTIAAIQKAKPWLVAILSGSDLGHTEVAGTGLVLTSDGLIATSKNALPANGAINVALQDGTIAQATIKAQDPASDLVLIKIDRSNLSTAQLGFPKDLELGQRMVVLSASPVEYQATDMVSYLSSDMHNFATNQVFSDTQPNLTFAVDGTTNVMDGSAILSLDGNIQGIYSSNAVINADYIKAALNAYFANNKISRNYLGLNYQYISRPLANLYNLQEGVILKRNGKAPAVLSGSPGQAAGLAEGDIIYKMDDTPISLDSTFADLLAAHKPGDTIALGVLRGKDQKTINITVGSR